VIKTVIGELAHGAVSIQTDFPETNVRVRMDVQDLHSVLTHLMTNAIEASCAGEAVKVRLKANDSRVVIDVEDKGPGMDTAFVRNELFTPLRSTKSRGHGIGAFQARETIRAAGGDLEVLSVAGQGTIMRIIVPNAAPPVSSVSPVSQKVAPA
jgi:signal transduction histidine kinase